MNTMMDTRLVDRLEVMEIGEESARSGEMADMIKVEDMLQSLLIDRGGAATWEQDEHDWLDNLTMKQMTSLEVDNTTWFGYSEERNAHDELEAMFEEFKRLGLLCRESMVRHEEPEPTQGGTPGCAANSEGTSTGCPDGWGGACTPPLPTEVKPQPHCSLAKKLTLCPIPRGGQKCGNCAKWIVHIKSIAAKGTASQFIPSELNILSSGAEYSEEENEEEMLENINKSNKQESTITKEKEHTMNETRNKTVSEARNQPNSEPRIYKGNSETNIENLIIGSCGHPPGDESEPGGELREQEPVQTCGQERRAAPKIETDRCTDSGTSSQCQPALGRRVMVPGRGRTRKKKEEGMVEMRRIEDLIELMGSHKRKRKEFVGNECLQKRSRECLEKL